MPTYSTSLLIPAVPAKVCAYVADLTRHGEWAGDAGLSVKALTPGPVRVGQRFESTVMVQGQAIRAEIEITDYTPPTHFAFRATDLTGQYEHRFTCEARGDQTYLTRTITAQLSLQQTVLFWIVFPFRKLPNTKKALERLKECLQEK